MKFDNALVLGENTPTNAEGEVVRVGKGGFCDALKGKKPSGDKIFISSLIADEYVLGKCFDYCYEHKPELIVCAGDDLYDAGVLEAKYHLSPVMFLHKAGLLNERCSVVGGVCFDRDDADIMALTGAKLIVCPTYSCAMGRGIPLVTPALGKIKVRLATYDNTGNAAGDIIEEARTLYLGTCSAMRKCGALSYLQLAEMAGADRPDEFAALIGINFR